MADSGNRIEIQSEDSAEHKKSLKRSWRSSGPVAKLTVVFAGIAALSTAIYSIFAGGQLLIMRGQLHEMNAAKRPWVGLSGELKMTRPPNFRVSESLPRQIEVLKKSYPHIDDPIISIEVWTSWSIQNSGGSPARRVNHTLIAYASEDANDPPTEVKNMACTIGNQMSVNPRVLSPSVFPGSVVPIPEGNEILGLARGTKSILGIWLIGCITYEDTAGNVHHTKIFWASDLSNAPKPELVIENPPLSWTPFTRFRLVESDVD